MLIFIIAYPFSVDAFPGYAVTVMKCVPTMTKGFYHTVINYHSITIVVSSNFA